MLEKYKCMENNTFDNKIFSQELIEKSNLMKESDEYVKDRLKFIKKFPSSV